MPDPAEYTQASGAPVALCIETDVFRRFGPVLRYLITGLVDQAFPIQIVSSDPAVTTVALGPVRAVVHTPLTWPFAVKRTELLIEALSEQPPRIVHALSAESLEVASTIAREYDADLVVSISSMADVDVIAATGDSSGRRLLCTSESLSSYVQSRLRAEPESLLIVRPGVLASDTVSCFSDAERDCTILCTTDLEPDRSVHLLIEAMALLGRRGANALCFILGQGRAESNLRQLARARGLTGVVTFASPAGDISHAFRNADIFVDATMDEAFQVNTLRAMASGMAVVTLSRRVSDFVIDGQTARVCPRATAESLSDALSPLIEHREEAQRLARAGAEYVRVNHSVSAMADATVDLYRKLIYSNTTFPLRQ